MFLLVAHAPVTSDFGGPMETMLPERAHVHVCGEVFGGTLAMGCEGEVTPLRVRPAEGGRWAIQAGWCRAVTAADGEVAVLEPYAADASEKWLVAASGSPIDPGPALARAGWRPDPDGLLTEVGSEARYPRFAARLAGRGDPSAGASALLAGAYGNQRAKLGKG